MFDGADSVTKTVVACELVMKRQLNIVWDSGAPGLEEVVASIVCAGSEQGRLEVRLLDAETKRSLVCSASQRLVDHALSLPSQFVRALIVNSGGKSRLLRLRGLAEAAPIINPADRESLLWLRWDELMRRFASG